MTAPLHVEIRGTGPDLVLLHGWALHGGMWGPWLDELARRARLHLIDLPGHGRSPWPAGASTLRDLARAVSPHVPNGAAVLGWSLGGMVALELARSRPGDLAALVLIATTPCFLARDDWPVGMNPGVLDGFAAGLAGDYRRTLTNFLALQTWGDENASQALRSLRANLDSHGEPDPQALVAGLGILRTADLRDALAAITVPTLVIAGEHDRITPVAAGRELASRLPSARFVEVPKAEAFDIPPIRGSTASVKPRNRLPVSPMKIMAGGKFRSFFIPSTSFRDMASYRFLNTIFFSAR